MHVFTHTWERDYSLLYALNIKNIFDCNAFFPQVLYSDTFNALHELLRNVLARDLSPDGLQSVFKVKEKL